MKSIIAAGLLLFPAALFAACSATDVRGTKGAPTDPSEPATHVGNCDSLGQGNAKDSVILDHVFLYRTYLEQRDTIGALEFWRYIFREAPGYDEGIYTQGLSMYKTLIRTEANEERRERLIDTLFMIWDKRIECFGKECQNLGRKALDMVTYRKSAVAEIKVLFDKAMEVCGDEPEYFVITYWISLNAAEYRKGNLTCDDMLKMYERVLKIIKQNEGSPHYQYYKQTEESTVNELTRLGCMDCDKLVPIFSQRITADPDNPELWKQAWSNLKNCKDQCDEPILTAFSKLLDVEPNAELARWLFSCLVRRERFREALPFGEKAVELEANRDTKASLALNVAQVHQKLGNSPKSREWANKALEIRPGWGDAFIHIGYLYAASAGQCSSEPFEGRTVFWAAIDKWERAKSDPSTAEEASRLISRYWSSMPTNENLFNSTLIPLDHRGQTYTVGCWIQETTTIRTSDGN